MTQKYWKEQSRLNWYTPLLEQNELSTEHLQTGAIMRIADATEAMAKSHVQLQNDRDHFERRYKQERACAERLVRSNNALRGYIKRLKKKSLAV